MNEAGQWFLGVVQALEKRLRLAWILAIGLGALLWLDRFHREEVNLGDYGRPTAQIVVTLAVATILVVAAITLGPICWRGLREFLHEALNPFEQELREAEERKQREWDAMYAEAEARNADRDLMFKLNRWIGQLPDEAIKYLIAIQRQQEDEIWAWSSDPWIKVLVEREFLEAAPGRYTQQQRYLIPNRTKVVLGSRAAAFREATGIERSPWERHRGRL